MVDADNDELTIIDNPEDTNYYAPVQDDDTSNNGQDNEAAHENYKNTSLHKEAQESDGEIRPDETQSYNGNDNLIPSVETISNNAHWTDDNDTTEPREMSNNEPTPDQTGGMQTRPRRLATYVDPVIIARGSHYTSG